MRTFRVKFADGLVMELDACDRGDACRCAGELHPDVEVVDVALVETE